MNIFSLLVKEKHLTNSKTGVSVLLIKLSQLNDILPRKNNGNLTSKFYDRHDDFNFFSIFNFLFYKAIHLHYLHMFFFLSLT